MRELKDIPRSETKTKHRVIMTESERGWGSKVDEIIYFNSQADAEEYADLYNATYNNKTTVPDWYIYAEAG